MSHEPSSLWSRFPLKTGHALLDPLLLAVPVAVALKFTHAPALPTFIVAAAGIIPLAAVLGESTEDLAVHTGPALGGLLNATLGNATELILAFLMLRAGQQEVVKASLSGSIIGNVLLVLGLSALAGGLGREKQQFSRQMASVNSTLLFIAVVALVMPAVFALTIYGRLGAETHRIEHLSLATAAVLIAIYVASMVFSFVTNKPHASSVGVAPEAERRRVSLNSSLIALAVATGLVAFLSEILVSQLEAAKRAMAVSDLFMGVIVIAIIGNAAEHATAVMMARRDRMTLAVSIAIGSSTQIALFVAPVLVFAGWVMDRPMSLVFTPFEIAGVALAVLIMQMIASDGETTWFEGAELIAVYLILAVSFYFVPA
ncbi:MAG: calcium/proton exchanger [Terriglobales bacterium]